MDEESKFDWGMGYDGDDTKWDNGKPIAWWCLICDCYRPYDRAHFCDGIPENMKKEAQDEQAR